MDRLTVAYHPTPGMTFRYVRGFERWVLRITEVRPNGTVHFQYAYGAKTITDLEDYIENRPNNHTGSNNRTSWIELMGFTLNEGGAPLYNVTKIEILSDSLEDPAWEL